MVQAMRGATKLLGTMNRNMNLPAIQRIAMEFERENDMMDQRQEMMDDAIHDTFEDEEEETDEIVNQVLDEIGIDLSQSVPSPASTAILAVWVIWEANSVCVAGRDAAEWVE